jgi:hypothetical protein
MVAPGRNPSYLGGRDRITVPVRDPNLRNKLKKDGGLWLKC